MFLKMLAVFVPKDFVRCGDMRVIARESTQTATFATLEKILGPNVYEHWNYHKECAYEVLNQMVDTALRYRQN